MKRFTVRAAAVLLALAMPAQAADSVHSCTQLFAGRTSYGPGTKGVVQTACLWKKSTLKVRFLEGDPVVHRKIENIAAEWEQYSGIKLVFGNFSDADIRITFQQTGSWSYVGLCKNDRQPQQATMNFGWLYPHSADSKYPDVVLHEFGHALGLVHEHQHPKVSIPWNEPALFTHHKKQDGWSEAKTRQNVIEKYSEGETNFTAYDRRSIMHYPIPRELVLDPQFVVGWNNRLSELDKRFMREQYGNR